MLELKSFMSEPLFVGTCRDENGDREVGFIIGLSLAPKIHQFINGILQFRPNVSGAVMSNTLPPQ